MTACVWKEKMFDCHSFPHSGSAKLTLWSVAGTPTEESVMAGDFSGRPEFSLEQSCLESVVVFKPSSLLIWCCGAGWGSAGPVLRNTSHAHMSPGPTPTS